jgi:hypothetical protein
MVGETERACWSLDVTKRVGIERSGAVFLLLLSRSGSESETASGLAAAGTLRFVATGFLVRLSLAEWSKTWDPVP